MFCFSHQLSLPPSFGEMWTALQDIFAPAHFPRAVVTFCDAAGSCDALVAGSICGAPAALGLPQGRGRAARAPQLLKPAFAPGQSA